MQEQFVRASGGKIIAAVRPSAPPVSDGARTANESGNARHEPRWLRTLALIRSGKTIIAEVAAMRGRTEATILQHLESLRAMGKLSVPDIAHLGRGAEPAIAEIHAAFRRLGADKLSPVFETFGGAHSYDRLRLARILLHERFKK